MIGGHDSGLSGGHGRGKNASPHVSSHENLVQDENKGNHREQQVDSEEVSLRQIMRSILEHLPLLEDVSQEISITLGMS